MWYEVKMLNETLDSVEKAIKNSPIEVDLMLCLNSQTYIEKPTDDYNPKEMFNEFINHPVLSKCKFIYKTDNDPFYNIGDWRRDIYGSEYPYKYIVWGESDCLVPSDYFFLLSHVNIDHPHVLSVASRKMWDSSWDEVEHEWIRQFPRNGPPEKLEQAPIPYNIGDYINLEQLNEFNSKFPPILKQMNVLKIDGNMTALSPSLPYPFLPLDLHFAREDFCLQMFFTKKMIPQYVISTRIAGHNRTHPLKRIGTLNQKNDEIYKSYENQSFESIINFIKNS
jgi:hypothetical protein